MSGRGALLTQVYGGEPSAWDQFMIEVQEQTGAVTDPETIDMIYTLYLHDASVRLVVSSIPGLQRAADAVRQARSAIREVKPMRYDQDPFRGFMPRAHPPTMRRAPRAGFIRRLPRHRDETMGIIGWALIVTGVVCAIVYAIHRAA